MGKEQKQAPLLEEMEHETVDIWLPRATSRCISDASPG